IDRWLTIAGLVGNDEEICGGRLGLRCNSRGSRLNGALGLHRQSDFGVDSTRGIARRGNGVLLAQTDGDGLVGIKAFRADSRGFVSAGHRTLDADPADSTESGLRV